MPSRSRRASSIAASRDRRRIVEELDAVIALRRRPAHEGARLLGRVDRAAAPDVAEHDIGEQPRRDDACCRGCAAGRDSDMLSGPVIEADAAHRGDAVREPEPVAVGGVRRLVRIAIMAVDVDEAGQHVHAGRVDLAVGVARARGSARSGRPGVPAPAMLSIRLPAMTMSTGPRGGAPRAVDQRRAADDEPAIGAFALAGLAVRHPLHPRRRLLRLIAGGRRRAAPASSAAISPANRIAPHSTLRPSKVKPVLQPHSWPIQWLRPISACQSFRKSRVFERRCVSCSCLPPPRPRRARRGAARSARGAAARAGRRLSRRPSRAQILPLPQIRARIRVPGAEYHRRRVRRPHLPAQIHARRRT